MSERLVVDASVAVKWLFPEEGSDRAIALIEGGHSLYAPDLLLSEIGNVLWKKGRKNNLSTATTQRLLDEFLALPVQIVDSRRMASRALELARTYDRSFYDSLYLALTETIDAVLVTADSRFANALGATAFGMRIITLDKGQPS